MNLSRRRLLLTGCALTAAQRASGGETARARQARQFDAPRFIEECRAAAAQRSEAQAAISELLARELADCDAVIAGLGAPVKGGLRTLYQSPALTILNIAWSPLMQLLPHEHNMWALIGIYTGREDNIFWQRGSRQLKATGAAAISAGSVTALPHDVIHSVSNPIEKLTGAIHIYGGDFFRVHRSEWNPETLLERAWDVREAVRNFEQSNARFFGAGASGCNKTAG